MISRSTTPFHLAMALQPSTQSWRVIWVRAGSALISSSEKLLGSFTSPATSSLQRGQPAMVFITYSIVKGGGLPLGLKYLEISASLNSWASLPLGVTSRSSQRFAPSTDSRMERTVLFWWSELNMLSQPERTSSPVAWSAPSKMFRRDRKELFFCIIIGLLVRGWL